MLIAAQLESAVERNIEGGRCVALDVTTDGSQRTDIEPSTELELTATPRSRVDGTPTRGTVLATLSGGSLLEPAGEKVPAVRLRSATCQHLRATAASPAQRKASLAPTRATSLPSALDRSSNCSRP